MKRRDTFVDYVFGGRTRLHCIIGIDFTASNGQPKERHSVHYLSRDGSNEYTVAMRAVGDIMQDYMPGDKFSVFGFGGIVCQGDSSVSQKFPLNGSLDDPFCETINDVVESYSRALGVVTLYGPANLTPLLEHVISLASSCKDGSHYYLLLVITDGIISDMEKAKEALVKLSDYPASVIIVGVGKEDFSEMAHLQNHEVRIRSKYLMAKRDISQFVVMRDYLVAGDWYTSKTRLAAAVMKNIPRQLLRYMKMKHLKPGGDERPPGSPMSE